LNFAPKLPTSFERRDDLIPTVHSSFSRLSTLFSEISTLDTTTSQQTCENQIIITCATCTMDAKKDAAVAMVEETAFDSMASKNAITNDDDTVAPPSGETDLSANASCGDRKKCLLVTFGLLLVILASVCVGVGVSVGVTGGLSGGGGESGKLATAIPNATAEMTDDPLGNVSDDPPEPNSARKSNVDQVVAYMVNASVSDLTALTTIGSPQNRAALWLAEQDAANTAVPAGNATALESYNYMARYVMAVFYYSTGGENWDVQYFFMTIAPICDWNNARIDGPNAFYRRGIICDEETDLVFGLDYGK
jgi:hypothetical protein